MKLSEKNGNRSVTVSKAEKDTGISKMQVSRWGKYLSDPEGYRQRLFAGQMSLKPPAFPPVKPIAPNSSRAADLIRRSHNFTKRRTIGIARLYVDPNFQRWCGAQNAKQARAFILQECGVESRHDLTSNVRARLALRTITRNFRVGFRNFYT